MSKNVGMVDRVIRVVAGLVLIAFALGYGFPNTGWNWVGWIGVVPLVTGLLGSCPAYSLLGWSSCPVAARFR
jgi:membrane-associated protease RseP (regulator of RpoE activity)